MRISRESLAEGDALSSPPTDLPEIWCHFSPQIRHALVWYLWDWSTHPSDVVMFQYWNKRFVWLHHIKNDSGSADSTEKMKLIFHGHRGSRTIYFSYCSWGTIGRCTFLMCNWCGICFLILRITHVRLSKHYFDLILVYEFTNFLLLYFLISFQ